MKKINSTALGIASTILLAAGFNRLAQKLDPLTNAIGKRTIHFNSTEASASPCQPCFFQRA